MQIAKLKKLVEILSPVKVLTLLFIGVSLFFAIFETVGISMIMPIISVVVEGRPPEQLGRVFVKLFDILPKDNILLYLFAILIALNFSKNLLDICKQYLSLTLTWALNERWMNDIFKVYLYSPYSFIISRKQGRLINDCLLEPIGASQGILQILHFITNSFLFTFLYGLMWFISWKVTLIFSALGMCSMFFSKFSGKNLLKKKSLRKLEVQREQHSLVAETIIGMKLVKTFSVEKTYLDLFKSYNKEIEKIRIFIRLVGDLPVPIGDFLMLTGICTFLLYVERFTAGGIKGILPFLAVLVITSRKLMSYIPALTSQYLGITQYIPNLTMVQELSLHEHNERELYRGLTFETLESDIIFDNVNFAYKKGQNVFENLNLKIQKNKMTALIGPSGVGKSTLVDLILGLYKLDSGKIIINGKPIESYSLASLRKRIGFVSQDTVLLHTSLKENIRIGNPEATDDEVKEAAKLAALDDFIETLPKKYETLIGDRGLLLSGGQRQRVAIARAILRNPEIYIFDEATSALDNDTEKLIQKSIEELGKKKTVIVIAHRLTTIENADIVYDIGKIAEKSHINHATL